MRRLPFLLALLGLTPLLGSTGCDVAGLACTEIGCTNQVVVTLSDNGGIPQGTFDLVVTIDGDERSCVLTADGDAVTSGSCQASIRQAFSGDKEVRSLDVAFTVPAGGVPPEVSVRVQREGTVLADGPIALRVESVSPNGVDCSPTCRLFRTTVVVG